MSRSYYKHNAGARSRYTSTGHRWFRRKGQKRWRRLVKEALRRGEEPPELRAADDVWEHPKDGRAWYGEGRRRQ